jgi:TonB family protein
MEAIVMRWILFVLGAVLTTAACAQSISGRVYDQTGGVVSGARVVLLEDFNKITETKSSDRGDFSFKDLKPGAYQVQVKQHWFQIFQQLVPLKQGENPRVYAVLNVARSESELGMTRARLPGVQQPAGAVNPYRLGGKVEGLKRVSGRMPAWPEAAVQRGAAGAVVLYATVKTDGSMADVTVLESPDPDLEHEVVEAYNTWKYQPMKLDGQPVESRQVLVFNFQYGQR